MKFVHIADMHFDIPFTLLTKNDFGNKRRLEQRQVFKQIIEYIIQNDIEYLFISGDLYEHEYVKQSTIEYINNSFKEIPNTKVYIVPGNHDPKLLDSYYNTFNWNSNVFIFDENPQKVSENEVDIYGFGFNNFYRQNSNLERIKIENSNKINILLTHGALDASNKEDMQYNPISKKELKQLGFDYVALGHIHKPSYEDENMQSIVYPGSTISLGFDELGKHGMIVGNIDKNKKLQIEFVPLDKTEFVEKELDVTEITSKDEIIEILNEFSAQENKFYKIILVGKRAFEIDTHEILKEIKVPNILKIKDNTKIKIDLNELSKQKSLKGIFVKNMLGKINEENEEQIIKAIEIGLDAM